MRIMHNYVKLCFFVWQSAYQAYQDILDNFMLLTLWEKFWNGSSVFMVIQVTINTLLNVVESI